MDTSFNRRAIVNTSKYLGSACVLSVGLFLSASAFAGDDTAQRGRYLVEIGGCNDCHTAGYAPSGGTVPEEQWLLGDSVGFMGPWGTTYPANLREYFNKLTENEWVERAKTVQTRPPMPWWALNSLTEEDARALYRYVTSLESVANAVPIYLPPGQRPEGKYVEWHVPAD
jgi:mono/diheme cytochrome c family protein